MVLKQRNAIYIISILSSEWKCPIYMYMYIYPVVDLGFSKGGSKHVSCAKLFATTPTSPPDLPLVYDVKRGVPLQPWITPGSATAFTFTSYKSHVPCAELMHCNAAWR